VFLAEERLHTPRWEEPTLIGSFLWTGSLRLHPGFVGCVLKVTEFAWLAFGNRPDRREISNRRMFDWSLLRYLRYLSVERDTAAGAFTVRLEGDDGRDLG